MSAPHAVHGLNVFPVPDGSRTKVERGTETFSLVSGKWCRTLPSKAEALSYVHARAVKHADELEVEYRRACANRDRLAREVWEATVAGE